MECYKEVTAPPATEPIPTRQRSHHPMRLSDPCKKQWMDKLRQEMRVFNSRRCPFANYTARNCADFLETAVTSSSATSQISYGAEDGQAEAGSPLEPSAAVSHRLGHLLQFAEILSRTRRCNRSHEGICPNRIGRAYLSHSGRRRRQFWTVHERRRT